MAINRLFIWILILLLWGGSYPATAGKIRDRQNRFKIALPKQMISITDASIDGRVYFDSSAAIIMMISGRDSKFKSVAQYIDCSRDTLEDQLRICYGNALLRLVSCQRSTIYPRKTTILHFMVSVLPMGFDSYIIYFIHYRNRDIQFAFTYKKANEDKSMRYIESVMKTLRLR